MQSGAQHVTAMQSNPQRGHVSQEKGSAPKKNEPPVRKAPMISDEDIQALRDEAEHFGTLSAGEEISLRDDDTKPSHS
jgi:hypothetical protein